MESSRSNYVANYGIGYEVEKSNKISESNLKNGLVNYILENLKTLRYKTFQTGDISYNRIPDSVFIVINDPFEYGLNLSRVKRDLEVEIERLKLKPVGNFGPVGGLEVWYV